MLPKREGSIPMEDAVRRLEKLQKGEEEDDKDGVKYIKQKQDRYNLIRTREPFQADYILMEILGLRPDTPDLDERTTTQELEDLEVDARRKDAILEDWQTPPGSPWGRSEDTTYDTTSLSWDTEEITFGTPPTSWDVRKEKEEKPSANKTSTGDTESDDSLPELVSDDTEEEDDGLVVLNTPINSKSNEEGKTEEEKRNDERGRKNHKDIRGNQQEGQRSTHGGSSNRRDPRHGGRDIEKTDTRDNMPSNGRTVLY